VKIVAGLGNPGAEYASTPHSAGYEVVDALASEAGVAWDFKKSFNADLARIAVAGTPVLLVKSRTYMNLSGGPIADVVKYHNATAADLIVVQDDIDLPLGRMRIRKGGSAGGHNGIRNIAERLGTQAFARLKLGVGKDKSDVVGHVLGKFAPEQRELMDAVVAEAVKAVVLTVKEGPDRAMNAYNGWSASRPRSG
jgi:PTH1 family peptidyl-tRNA hydrolase